MTVTPQQRREAIFAAIQSGARRVDVAREYGVSVKRISQLYLREEREQRMTQTHVGRVGGKKLSTRAVNCLRNAGFNHDATQAEVLARIDEIRDARGRPNINNMGIKTLREIEQWLGSPPCERTAYEPIDPELVITRMRDECRKLAKALDRGLAVDVGQLRAALSDLKAIAIRVLEREDRSL